MNTDIEAALLALAERLSYEHEGLRVWPLRASCPPTDHHNQDGLKRGWVPVALGPNTLRAALARCGVILEYHMRDPAHVVAARRRHMSVAGPRHPYDPTDADSITIAELRAALEEVK